MIFSRSDFFWHLLLLFTSPQIPNQTFHNEIINLDFCILIALWVPGIVFSFAISITFYTVFSPPCRIIYPSTDSSRSGSEREEPRSSSWADRSVSDDQGHRRSEDPSFSRNGPPPTGRGSYRGRGRPPYRGRGRPSVVRGIPANPYTMNSDIAKSLQYGKVSHPNNSSSFLFLLFLFL